MSPEDPVMVSVSSQSGMHPDEISRRAFPSARKGVDPEAVRRFLETVAVELQEVLDREQAVRRRLADAERRAAEPELDEATLLRALGAETARILQTAHEAAADVIAKAEGRAVEIRGDADAVLGERTAVAKGEAAALLAAAQSEAEALTDATFAEASAVRETAIGEAEAVTDAARSEAIALLDATRTECRRIVREAREIRASVLGDLIEQRRGLRIQLEQLRTGRDSLVGVVDAVGSAVDHLRDRLANAEHEARLAAAEAGERVEAEPDDNALFEAEAEIAVDIGEETHEELSAAQSRGGSVGREFDEPEVAVRILPREEIDLLVDEGLAGELAGPELYDEEAGAAEDAGTQSSSHRSVDELFARIRAGRDSDDAVTPAGEEEPAEDEGVLGKHSAHEAAVFEADEEVAELVEPEIEAEVSLDAEPGAEPGAEPAAEPELEVDVVEVVEVVEVVAAVELESAGEPAEQETSDDAVAAPDAVSAVDTEALAARATLLGPATVKLARALKRALGDDQNILLDALRHASGAPDLTKLLPEEQQRTRIEDATTTSLVNAWTAGHSSLGGAEPQKADASLAGRRLASELAAEVTGLLRHRLSEALAKSEDGDGAADAAGAAYREWRGSRVEGTAGDFAVRSFSDGAVTGAPGALVTWVVDDDGLPCPDCDDNALAGTVPAGEEFPTGQAYPPVHPGCRCLLVPVTS